MLRRAYIFALCLALLAHAAAARLQEVVDRIAARVENDIILLSDVRNLAAYQLLVQGKKEPDAQLLDRLIDQWIVHTEAEASGYGRPSREEVDAEIERLRTENSDGKSLDLRLKESGLSEAELRRMVEAQIFLTGYLDSRFRPAVQVDAKAVEEYYQNTVLQLAREKGESPPSLESSRAQIRELLIQRGINEQADRWLKERRIRLHVEKVLV
jgi:parvulin-like peptidyl-prolyl isomerase